MKVLFDPIFTLKKLSGCSCYYKYKKVALELLKGFDNLFIYFIVPDGGWELDDLIDDPRVKNIPVLESHIRWNEYYREPEGFFQKFGFLGEYGDWDILITSRVPMVPVMRMAGHFTIRTPDKLVIVLDDLPIMEFKKAIQPFEPLIQERMQVQGYLNSDLTFLFANFERDNVLRTALDYIQPSELKRLHQIIKTGFFYCQAI